MNVLGLVYWQETAIKAVAVILAVLLPAGGFVQAYLFKMVSHLQSRLGPMEAGPHGSLQLMADGGKFIQKELLWPERADRRIFVLAPVVVLISTFLIYVVIPAGPSLTSENLDTGVFYALAVSSL